MTNRPFLPREQLRLCLWSLLRKRPLCLPCGVSAGKSPFGERLHLSLICRGLIFQRVSPSSMIND